MVYLLRHNRPVYKSIRGNQQSRKAGKQESRKAGKQCGGFSDTGRY